LFPAGQCGCHERIRWLQSETLLLAGVAGVVLYLLLFALDRFVRHQSARSSVRSA
jgi:hypothetical protein